MSGDLLADLADSFEQHRERQRQRDNLPCPLCGGDRLRGTFNGPGKCHLPITKN